MSISDGDEGLRYWVRWQVPVCALIIGGPAFFAVKFVRNLKAEPLNYNDLWTPCWRNLNPLWLLIFRASAFVCLAWVLYEIVSVAGAFSFYFYTQWTFALVMVYFVLGTVVSAYGCWFSSKKLPSSKVKGTANLKSHYAQEEIQGKLRFWGYLMQTVYQTCAGAAILTDVVFWCLLVPFFLGEQFSQTLLIGCLHSLNAIFLLLDTALNNLPFPWFGFAYFVIWSCLYVSFQWTLHACGFTWWPYPFLELRTPWAPLWYFVIMYTVFIPIVSPLIVHLMNSTNMFDLQLMGCMHTLNAFFLLVDTSLNSLPFPWFWLAYFVIWSCLYVIFQWVIHACGFTWWPYPFLELDTPWAPLWYFCMAVVHIPCYGIYALIIRAKNSILPRLFPHAFIRSR